MNVIRYRDTPEQPWRNGRGVTRELHRGNGWRLSVATIARAGAFSAFPGLDRVFVVAGGAVELDVDGVTRALKPGDEARFPGEAAVSAVPAGGPAFAVNVMTTRATHRAEVRVTRLNGRVTGAQALVLLEGTVTVRVETAAVLAPLDAVVLTRHDPNAVHCADALVVLVTVALSTEGTL